MTTKQPENWFERCCEQVKNLGASEPESLQETLDLCDTIIGKCEEVPENGEDFAQSVEEKTRDIKATIESSRRVMDGQKTALDNMLSGVERWLR